MSDTHTTPSGPTRLDAFLVIASVVALIGVLAILAFVHVPQENLPILASLASGVFGAVVGSYVGYRWGASESAKRPPAAQPVVSVEPPATVTVEEGAQ